MFAIPNIILHSKAQSTTPAAPKRKREFLLKKASICNPMASRYRAKAEERAVAGLSKTFLAKFALGEVENNLDKPVV